MMLKNVIFWLLLLKMCVIFGQGNEHQRIIVIDVGHGGKDPGAIGVGGIREKDVVLNIGKEIIRQNRKVFDNTLQIYLTRYTDTLISLHDRTRLSKTLNPDLLISLHCNSYNNPAARGIELYVATRGGEHSTKSILLGSVIQKELGKIGFESRGVKTANFAVLRKVHCPANLIEIGFVSNPDEGRYFIKPSNIQTIAVAILKGIIDYLKIEL